MLIRTPADAERAAASAMRTWGWEDADPAAPGPDGGVDVRATGAVAQVKAKTAPTGRPDVQQLVGIARYEGVQAFFFSLAGYTDEAIEWGTAAEVALFEFDLQGKPSPVNQPAQAIENLDPVEKLAQWHRLTGNTEAADRLERKWAKAEEITAEKRRLADLVESLTEAHSEAVKEFDAFIDAHDAWGGTQEEFNAECGRLNAEEKRRFAELEAAWEEERALSDVDPWKDIASPAKEHGPAEKPGRRPWWRWWTG